MGDDARIAQFNFATQSVVFESSQTTAFKGPH
jgi:hypothetical protein